MAKGLEIGAVGIWIAMSTLDWGFQAIVYSVRWKSGRWWLKQIM